MFNDDDDDGENWKADNFASVKKAHLVSLTFHLSSLSTTASTLQI